MMMGEIDTFGIVKNVINNIIINELRFFAYMYDNYWIKLNVTMFVYQNTYS